MFLGNLDETALFSVRAAHIAFHVPWDFHQITRRENCARVATDKHSANTKLVRPGWQESSLSYCVFHKRIVVTGGD
jgi:hypothetical protein